MRQRATMGDARGSWGLWVLLIAALALPFPTQSQSLAPEIQRGLAWLHAQVQADGTLRGEAQALTLPTPARAETAITLGALGGSIPATLQALLAPTVDDPVEWLARKALAQAEAGLAPGAALQRLAALQNSDGGFGADQGYPSNPLDTAWALQALAVDKKSNANAIKRALTWLVGVQQTDGRWELVNDGDHVPTTALASRALWLHRQAFPVEAALDRAEAFLQARRVGSGWQATFATAQVLIALLPRHDDTLPFADPLTALRGAQLANGSWDDDPFTTALALRALMAAANPVPNPDLGSIRGRIVDGDSNFPLSGATVVLAGAASRTLTTAADGRFQFQGLPAGSYNLAIQLAGYGALTTVITLPTGGIADLGDVRMLSAPINPTTGMIRGQVTDAATGQPLAGATVAASGQTIQTGADGRYQLSNVTRGVSP
jgi:hypothetical protein